MGLNIIQLSLHQVEVRLRDNHRLTSMLTNFMEGNSG